MSKLLNTFSWGRKSTPDPKPLPGWTINYIRQQVQFNSGALNIFITIPKTDWVTNFNILDICVTFNSPTAPVATRYGIAKPPVYIDERGENLAIGVTPISDRVYPPGTAGYAIFSYATRDK